jgi:hypothetical protein
VRSVRESVQFYGPQAFRGPQGLWSYTLPSIKSKCVLLTPITIFFWSSRSLIYIDLERPIGTQKNIVFGMRTHFYLFKSVRRSAREIIKKINLFYLLMILMFLKTLIVVLYKSDCCVLRCCYITLLALKGGF